MTTKNIHPIDRLVGQRVRLLRLARGVSQSMVASKLGLTFQQLQKYERGTNRISASKLFEIAAVLGVGVADLFQDTTDWNKDHMAPAPTMKDDFNPTQIDLRIVHRLSQIRDSRIKRHMLNLISAVIGDSDP
jgi:transcriptional regulator with XRE-family HTH domain